MNRRTITVLSLMLLLGLALWQQHLSVNAKAVPPPTSFTVNTTNDTADANSGDGICADANGNCSLRAALTETNAQTGADTITFNLPAGPNTINLTGALPDVTDSLTITGPGAKLLTVRRDTGGDYRIFNIPGSGLNISISGLTITNGQPSGKFAPGGGILSSSHLTLTDCAIVGNHAIGGGGGVDLGFATGDFSGCTISDNTAGVQGGGIYFSGGDRATLRLRNSTISGNTANGGGFGGGIFNQAAVPSFNGQNTMEVINCTIVNNTSNTSFGTNGGGISAEGAITLLRNTIIANNTAPNLIVRDSSLDNVPGVITSLGNNLTNDNSNTFLNASGDKVNTDPMIGLLADNGGPTQTHALLTDSPAKDAGNNCVLTNSCTSNNLGINLITDQRGVTRPFPAGGTVDIGAFEVSNSAPTISALTVTRTAGAGASNSQIATVSDAEDAEDTLTVTSTPASGSGVTISGISVDSSGNVTANVAAICTATTSTFNLTVTDSGSLSDTKTLTVTVTPDAALPVITLNGANPMTVECPTGFVDPGAAATDTCAGSVAVTSSGSVNTAVPGSYTITYTANDGQGNTATATRTVNVVDTTAPTLTLKAPISVWPPNHSYRTVTMSQMVQSVGDGCNTSLSINDVVIEKVTSDEPDNAAGDADGDTTNDIVIAAGCKSVQLRIERDETKNGRVYVVTLRVRDAAGNTTRKDFSVSVPISQNGLAAVQDAAAQTKTSSCK